MTNKQKKHLLRGTLMAALTMVCAMVLTSCSSDDNNPATASIEYGQVFSYTYEGQTLYYIVNEKGEAAVVPPLHPNIDTVHDEMWTGYDKPVGPVVIPDYVPFNGIKCPVTTVEYCAFFRCYAITSVTLPSTLRTIQKHGFLYCSSLASVTVPEGVTAIGYGAFDKCVSMKSAKLPETLKSLGDYAFAYCNNLSEIYLPESLESIGACAFYECYNLESITLPSTLQSIGEFALSSCHKLNNVEFPDQLTQLNNYVLTDCQALTNCHLPAQLKTIDKAFFYSTAISNIEIPEHVTSIDTWAFGRCLSLKELTFPASVTELSDSVFCDGTKLDKLTLECSVPPTVTEETFDEDDYATTIIVPKGAGEAYRKHEFWGRFTTVTEKE